MPKRSMACSEAAGSASRRYEKKPPSSLPEVLLGFSSPIDQWYVPNETYWSSYELIPSKCPSHSCSAIARTTLNVERWAGVRSGSATPTRLPVRISASHHVWSGGTEFGPDHL